MQFKIIMFFIILSLAGGGYAYLQKLQKDNAILKINTTKLESAVSQNEQVIKQMKVICERNRKLKMEHRGRQTTMTWQVPIPAMPVANLVIRWV